MNQFLTLVISGAVTGAIYSIMASGLVLTYSTSGIFNFAHSAIAFSAAYLFFQLNSSEDVDIPVLPAAVITVCVFTPLLGLLLDRLLLRRLAEAPVYARIVGTIGLLIGLPNLMQWLVIDVGINTFDLGLVGNQATETGMPPPGLGPSPAHGYRLPEFLAGVGVNSDQIAVFIAASISAIGLWYVMRRTRVGLEMRAVVDRETLAGLRGVNAARTSAVAWVLTMLLAGLGGVLMAPLFDLSAGTFELVVLGSLAAVVLGGLRSLPLAFVGGLALGVVQNLIAGYSDHIPGPFADLSGLRSSIPYLLVLVLGLIVGRDKRRGAGNLAEGSPPPDHRAGLPTWRKRLPWVVFIVAIVAFSLQWVSAIQANEYAQTVIAQSLATAIIFLSFVVVTGMGGMVSLAQAMFVTAGGFTAGWALSRDWGFDLPLVASGGHLNFFVAMLMGGIVAAAVGALIALPATRLGGVYLAIWSLAAAFFTNFVIFGWEPIGHGQEGWRIPTPTLDVPGINWINGLLTQHRLPWNVEAKPIDFGEVHQQILLFLLVFGALAYLIHRLRNSASGRAILAVRSTETGAESVGVRANRVKIMMFSLSAGIAGIGGVCLGLFSFSVSSTTAPPQVGLFWVAIAVAMGVRRSGGALLAGIAFGAGQPIMKWLADLLPSGNVHDLFTSVYFMPLLFGISAIQFAQEPDGILALNGNKRLEKQRQKERRARMEKEEGRALAGVEPSHAVRHVASHVASHDGLAAGDATAPSSEGILTMSGIVAGYGDSEVLHGVSISLHSGKVTSLLGANGAGKSTLCAVAAGLVRATFGTVTMDGQSIGGRPAFERARGGLLLVPEARGIFPGLSVEENLDILLRSKDQKARVYDRFPILGQRRKAPAGVLSGGEQQMLSLAPALVEPPKVLIADEPTLGLAPIVAESILTAILELRDAGAAVLLVEEHASNAMRVADTLAFMELGSLVWTGAKEDADMEMLSAAYLGGTVARVAPVASGAAAG
jgi:branched-subunit amino acid ABC-type transport system permease component/ABC-type branched-subunit amino acid transport system ATPase component